MNDDISHIFDRFSILNNFLWNDFQNFKTKIFKHLKMISCFLFEEMILPISAQNVKFSRFSHNRGQHFPNFFHADF